MCTEECNRDLCDSENECGTFSSACKQVPLVACVILIVPSTVGACETLEPSQIRSKCLAASMTTGSSAFMSAEPSASLSTNFCLRPRAGLSASLRVGSSGGLSVGFSAGLSARPSAHFSSGHTLSIFGDLTAGLIAGHIAGLIAASGCSANFLV